jgi:hypothetical protein
MSETITVQFFGICTHLNPAVLREHDVQGRRVLLVNASSQAHIDEYPVLRDNGVGPHVARLQIAESDLVEPPPLDVGWMPFVGKKDGFLLWDLEGVRMRVVDAIETPDAVQEPPCIPQLAQFAGGPGVVLPDLGPAAWEERPELAACWFDFPLSPLEGRSWKDATAGVVTVRLPGPQAPPVLEITAFQNRGRVLIPVRAGAHISLLNNDMAPAVASGAMGAGNGDLPLPSSDFDFLLHFLALTEFPATVSVPEGFSTCPGLLSHNTPVNIDQMSGPGCGNAIYP